MLAILAGVLSSSAIGGLAAMVAVQACLYAGVESGVSAFCGGIAAAVLTNLCWIGAMCGD